MAFENIKDYLCYVEAVHLLYHESIKKNCDFLLNGKVYKDSTTKMNITKGQFLHKGERVKEYFFVIDNTEYPEALRDENWAKVQDRPEDGSKDVNVELSFQLTYTSNNKYFAWTFIFGIILITLGVILVVSIAIYVHKSFIYKRYARERKEMK